MNIKTIMVVGAGLMGRGITEVAANAGYKVLWNDLKPDLVHKGLENIEKSLARRVEKKKISEADQQRIVLNLKNNLKIVENLDEDCAADFVIEAIAENLEAKKELFKTLNGICRPETIFASNTSSLSVTALGKASLRPERFVGMHFFNPVPAMPLVELVKGTLTGDEAYQTAKAVAEKMGKETVLAPEYPGFLVNRILLAMTNEALACVMEGAKPEDVDKAMRLGCNFPMGPVELLDYIGLDIALAALNTIYEGTGKAHFKPSPLLKNMVEGGLLGRKSGRGFYQYSK
ncbi:MAG: 3-hydroxyacyl-CoA dehydrogenase NAD-binding domain-containing protein [Kiritimatiellia bacterium]|nr:3-hydroxyacyl-CoA dehydrogenase NAD-binding domain-containing protein [Kiritimatiellia bacterium]